MEGSAARVAPTVFVIDDEPDVRASLTDLLSADGHQVAAFGDVSSFLSAFPVGAKGCIVLDLGLPKEDGMSFLRRAVPDPVDIPVIVLSGRVGVDSAVEAMERGAITVVAKPFSPGFLLDRVRSILRDEELAWQVRRERVELRAGLALLTTREREVLTYALRGRTSLEVAQALGISYRTVEVHRSRVLQKTGMEATTELIYQVMRLGLVDTLQA
jgi:two-component system, LuxR family, response regulator FixJ